MEYAEFLLGWFLGIISLIIAEVIGYLFTKRNMKAEHEHSERMLRLDRPLDLSSPCLANEIEQLKKPDARIKRHVVFQLTLISRG